ncbi:hypothetical protein ACNPPY_12820 [Achromobacter sp. AGC78]
MFRETVFVLEQARKDALVAEDLQSAKNAKDALHDAWRGTGVDLQPGHFHSAVSNAQLGSEMIRKLSDVDYKGIQSAIGDEDFGHVKDFVSELYDVELANTELARVSEQFYRQYQADPGAEASAYPCGLDGHLIVVPTTGFQSLDLLAHELGHTAEFSLRRRLDQDWALANRPVVSETIAYYSQFHYLRTSGSKEQRAGALNAFMPAYFSAQFLFAMLARKRPPHELIQDQRFTCFFDSDRTTRQEIIHHLEPLYAQTLPEIYMNVDKLFSIPIALKLLDRPEEMKRLALLNYDQPLFNLLDTVGIDPSELLDFRDLDSLFDQFIEEVTTAAPLATTGQ